MFVVYSVLNKGKEISTPLGLWDSTESLLHHLDPKFGSRFGSSLTERFGDPTEPNVPHSPEVRGEFDRKFTTNRQKDQPHPCVRNDVCERLILFLVIRIPERPFPRNPTSFVSVNTIPLRVREVQRREPDFEEGGVTEERSKRGGPTGFPYCDTGESV